jgi:PAS domain S-box-containing protein
MSERKRITLLICIMATACLTVGGIAIFLLYRTAFDEEQARLVQTAQSQARLIEAVARFDAIHSKDYPGGSEKATLSQIVDAHEHYRGFGKTGEFTLARHEKDHIVFLLSHRHLDLQSLKPVLFRSRLAEPMRRALSGLSGTVIGLDYRGENVLAAYEPVQELDLGIVAKIDLAELREPFVRAGAVAAGMAILVVLAGAGLFVRISTPIIKHLEEHSASLTTANEELKREIAERKLAERALQDGEDLLKKTQEIAHVGSWSLDLKKNELYWSDEVYRIFGMKPQAFGATYEAFLESIPFEDREIVDKAYNEAVRNHTPYEVTHRVLRPDGEVRVVHEKSVDIVDEFGKTIRSIGMVHDITERKRAEEALREAHKELERRVEERTAELVRANEQLEDEVQKRNRVQLALKQSQERYKELWEHAPAAYHTLDVNGIVTQANQTELDMLGYTRDEMVGRPIFDFVQPEQRDDAEERFRLKLTGKEVPKHDNRIYLKKDGSKVIVSIDDVLERDNDGKVVGVRTTMVDVSELKRAQEELRHLSVQLIDVQEHERKRIAGELHDSIGQSLTAIKFGLENALSRIRQGEAEVGSESLEALIPLVQQTSQEVRQIHTNLRPSLLDDLGIVMTVSWFCREFEKLYSGIRIEKAIQLEEKNMPDRLKIVVFRILQEALNNVAKHARANLVRVSLKETSGQIELAVEDNGRGFSAKNLSSVMTPKEGFGFTSMKERTELSGGTFAIESEKGTGTTIRASWPVKEKGRI